MFAAHVSSVLLVIVRMNSFVSSSTACTMPAGPKPNTKYASSNVIAICVDAFGHRQHVGLDRPLGELHEVAGGVSVVHAR